jgi:uncharacterized membrane protein HdeD (DUF308 family)
MIIAAENFAPPLPTLLHALARNWWLLLLRGICAVLFGVLTFLWPAITLITLVLLLGIYTLADGILSLAAAIMGGPAKSRWWLAVVGLLGIAAGIVMFLWPGVAALLLLIYIGAWSIATGVMQIIGAIALRTEIRDEWLLALLFVIGTFAIAYGIILILFSLRLHRHRH